MALLKIISSIFKIKVMGNQIEAMPLNADVNIGL